MNKTENLIKDFINEIKKEYNDLTLDCYYDSNEDFYEIWHADYYLNKYDHFLELVGQKLNDILYENNVYNISFGYDFDRTTEIYKEYRSNYMSLTNMEGKKLNINFSVTSKESVNDGNKDKSIAPSIYKSNTISNYQIEKWLVVA